MELLRSVKFHNNVLSFETIFKKIKEEVLACILDVDASFPSPVNN